jgi:hypothetical protein
MAQVVNPSVLGMPASDTNGNEVPWSLIIKSGAYALDPLNNTQILGNIDSAPGYCATLPFTPIGPTELLETSVFLDASTATLFGPPGETPTNAEVSSTAALLDSRSSKFYAPKGASPTLADVSSTAALVDGSALKAYSATIPEPAAVGTTTVVVGANIGSFAAPGSIPS